MKSADRAYRISLLACAILLSSAVFETRLLAQQQYPGTNNAEETTAEVRGKVVSIFGPDHTLVLQTENGKQITFALDQNTEIMTPIDPGSDIEVTYADVDGKKMARVLVNPALMLEREHATEGIHLMPMVIAAVIVVLVAVVLQRWRAKRRQE
ncbi:MAG: hypothetical protein ACLP1Y_01585 [Candidatus Acidiferrales bacterium]